MPIPDTLRNAVMLILAGFLFCIGWQYAAWGFGMLTSQVRFLLACVLIVLLVLVFVGRV